MTAHHRGVLPSASPLRVKSERTAKPFVGFAEPEFSHFSASKPCWQWAAGGLISFQPWYPSGDRWPGGVMARTPARRGSGPWHGTRTGSLCVCQRGPYCPETSQGQFARWWQSPCGIARSHPGMQTPLSWEMPLGGRFPSLPWQGKGSDRLTAGLLLASTHGCCQGARRHWIALPGGGEGWVVQWLSIAARCCPRSRPQACLLCVELCRP